MSEIDGAVKVPGASTAVIACPLLDYEGKPCRWSTSSEPPAAEAAKLIEWAAPGRFQVSSKAYADWYATVDRMVKAHLEQVHTVEEWAATMATFRTEHHATLEHLHADYGDRISGLTAERSSLERTLSDRVKQFAALHARIAQLEEAVGARGDLIKAWIAKYDAVVAKLVQLEELTAAPRSVRETYADDMIERAWGLLSGALPPTHRGTEWHAALEEWRRDYVAGDLGSRSSNGTSVARDDLLAGSHPESTRSTTAPAVIAPVQSGATELVE